MDSATPARTALSHRLKRLGHLDLPGGGQVVVQGDYAYIGHMEAPHGGSSRNTGTRRKLASSSRHNGRERA